MTTSGNDDCIRVERVTEEIRRRIQSELSPQRSAHVERVVETALAIAEGRAEQQRQRIALAAWSHDLCREWQRETLCEEVDRANFPLTETELQVPVMCHGPAAATVLLRDYGIRDREVLEAVRWHTTGKGGLGPVAKILYAADYLEPGRRYTSEEFRRNALGDTVEGMILRILEHLRSRGLSFAPETRELYDEVSQHVE